MPVIHDKKTLEAKLKESIQQMNEGKGTDFGEFLIEMKKKYGLPGRT